MVQEILRWGAVVIVLSWSFTGLALGLKLVQDFIYEREDRKEREG